MVILRTNLRVGLFFKILDMITGKNMITGVCFGIVFLIRIEALIENQNSDTSRL